MSFYDNLRIACDNKGTKVSPFIQSLGLNSANTGAWKNGGYPRVENLIEMADVLGVTTDYLLGREETKKEPTVIPYSGNERVDSIADKILKTDLTEDDLKLIEFILDKYK